MAKFLVSADVTYNYSLDVEAGSEAEAYELAEELPIEKWDFNGKSYLDIYDVEKIGEVADES
jgi:hypothetical protein